MGLLFNNEAVIDSDYYRKKRKSEGGANRKMSRAEFEANYYDKAEGAGLGSTGTSVFDPVLCETQYLWFTAEGDEILDPFAGGSVRGIVAVEMGRGYTGVDLRKEQVEANKKNANEICGAEKPKYICGDSSEIDKLVEGDFDFIFTCPPYGDLEKYSDDPADLSNMESGDFDSAYIDIIHKAASKLKDNRFACVVVGNYRDKDGFLRDLVGLTVRAFEEVGVRYYNEMIFATPIGSLPIRVGRAFSKSRKIGKTHQNVLCFVKGDPFKAAERLGEVEIPDLQAEEDE